MEEVRCGKCGRLLGKAGGFTELEIKCPRCGTLNSIRAVSPSPERHGASLRKAGDHGTGSGRSSQEPPFGMGRRQVVVGASDRADDSATPMLR
ncbi:MAG: Com family DNA-binding transcriptional regulator [Magnetococcales bacterium]|nr:Com family DNA-binding transcriptional regulator [Magnetococcales bacterium]